MAERINKVAGHLAARHGEKRNGLQAGVEAHKTSADQRKIFGEVGSASDDDVVIVSALRTPIGKARKVFKDVTPDVLLRTVLEGVLKDSKVDPKLIEDLVVGNVQQSGAYSLPARTAAVLAGIPESCAVRSVNRQCSSGLQAVADVASNIKSGYITMGIGAGVESMTMGGNPGDPSSMPPMDLEHIFQDPTAAASLTPMGITSENVAEKFGVTREAQDKMAFESHKRALKAQESGWFDKEIVPVQVKYEEDGVEKDKLITKDEGPRPTTMEGLAKLKPAFKKGGSTTAGNASQVSDGAAAVLLTTRANAKKLGLPFRAVFRGFSVVGVPANIMGIGPAEAIPAVLKATGLKKEDVDIFEINEAFASQATYCVEKLGLPSEKVNPVGSGISLGHPLGCTGARQIATVLNTLDRENKKVAVTSMCIGTGMGAASVIEKA